MRLPRLALPLMAAALMAAAHGAPVPAETDERKEGRLAAYIEREARCVNGSVMKVKLLDDKVTLRTPYGVLVIPLAQVTQTDCATRLPASVENRIAAAVKGLGSDEPELRDAAAAVLGKLKAKAYPALLKAEKEKDPEVVVRAKRLLDALREELGEEEIPIRPRDVIHTADSKFAGFIQADSLLVHTEQFGESKLLLHDVAGIGLPVKEPAEKPSDVLPNPGHLHSYQAQVGKVLRFQVIGAVDGSVWGTDFYTLDTTLAAAAVHAGVAQVGKAGVVTVRILPPRINFLPTLRNGVTSRAYANYPGAFEFVKPRRGG